MNPDLAFAVWSGERAARVAAVMDQRIPAIDVPPRALHEAMRYAALGGGKRVRPLLAFAAGELARRRSGRCRRRRRRGRADPRLLARARRSAVHGRRRAAARQADLPRRVRRGDRAAGRRRAAEPRVRGPGEPRRMARRRAARRCALLAAAAGSRGMAGGQAIDLAAVGSQLRAAGARAHAHPQDRRADPRGGAARCGAAAGR